ncbi:hypothetical protein [Microbacterium sp. zg-YB36]|uniref:hypothetical protein n=1 Tax=Microbacterium sp. zg-YB36 TaxID=2969407 RepID=UPI00214CC0DB|nr:hypothetical protein [Microbacterium sp. zg-YB36]MDL5351143.1 hypothetical protein [Microbacterium sp. zg-YB36]
MKTAAIRTVVIIVTAALLVAGFLLIPFTMRSLNFYSLTLANAAGIAWGMGVTVISLVAWMDAEAP